MYIIPGIVDRTIKSHLSLKLANSVGIKAMRLPIQEYVPNRMNHVLNVDTVIKIFCMYPELNGDWKLILNSVMPLRKLNNPHSKYRMCNRRR